MRFRYAAELATTSRDVFNRPPMRGDLRGLRSLSVGAYWDIYEVLENELVVFVVRVAHRQETYRRC